MDATTRMSDAACVTGGTGTRAARVRDRDDACPGTLDAAQGDDGLIARIRLPGGRVTADQLRALAAGARDFGKGVVDLTVRANTQVRGLSPLGVTALGRRLADAGLLPSSRHDRVRNISASPFAGRDRDALVDAEELVAALDSALCADHELADLPGRFQFAVDDGGVRIATARHDVALVAVARDVVALHVAGVDTGLCAGTDTAADLALDAARAFLRARVGNGAWHVRELPGGADHFASCLRDGEGLGTANAAAGAERPGGTGARRGGPGIEAAGSRDAADPAKPTESTGEAGSLGVADSATSPETRLPDTGTAVTEGGTDSVRDHRAPPRRAASPTVGVVAQHDGRFAVSALVPLGRLTADQLTALADIAESAAPHGQARVRLAPWRGVVVGDVSPEEVERVVAALEALGFPTSPTSAWRQVSACSGVGECRRAHVDIRALARDFVAQADSREPHGRLGAVHFAACARACGRPAGAAAVIAEEPAVAEATDGGATVSGPTHDRELTAFSVLAASPAAADALADAVRVLRPLVTVTTVGGPARTADDGARTTDEPPGAIAASAPGGPTRTADDRPRTSSDGMAAPPPGNASPTPFLAPAAPPADHVLRPVPGAPPAARTTPPPRSLPERQPPVDDWLKDGAEIYRRSFATIRAEADLSRFPDDVSRVVVRMIHACGMTDLPGDIGFHPDVARAASAALRAGAPILCDAQMVASGVTRARLPRENAVKCLLSDPRVPVLAAEQGTTRSAAAVDLWGDDLAGAVVAVGNAPTTLFRLLELLDAGAPAPAAIVGVPVGFIGAAESKQALAERAGDVPYLVVHGRRGGSAMAAAAINAMASEKE